MVSIINNLCIGEYMLTNKEKIDILITRLNTLDFIENSFILNAEDFKDKYSLEDELSICNDKRSALLEVLNDLGGSWPKIID
jgi:hypothetical protein